MASWSLGSVISLPHSQSPVRQTPLVFLGVQDLKVFIQNLWGRDDVLWGQLGSVEGLRASGRGWKISPRVRVSVCAVESGHTAKPESKTRISESGLFWIPVICAQSKRLSGVLGMWGQPTTPSSWVWLCSLGNLSTPGIHLEDLAVNWRQWPLVCGLNMRGNSRMIAY